MKLPQSQRFPLRLLLGAALLVPFLAASPALACTSGPNIWFQPASTIEKGNSILVTGTGINPGQRIEFTFSQGSPLPHFRYTTKPAQSSCVVNQEYIDTHLLKKGTYYVTARILGANPSINYSLPSLTIVAPTIPVPLPAPVNCGQTTHVWYGPSNVITYGAQVWIAGVVKPNTQVNYYFDRQDLPLLGSAATVQVAAPSNSCVTAPAYLPGLLTRGIYDVYAGFVDEYGRYNYSLQGQLTVN